MPDPRPLADILVLDLSQFLAGPVAALRLADLGARVLKVERPGDGEIGRRLAFGDRWLDGDSLSFHAMNRAKEGVVADLKNLEDLAAVRGLVRMADVLIQNFRPGVMARLGLGIEAVAQLNPSLVYVSGTGYGTAGPWATRPGQDLLAQAVSGLPWLSPTEGRPVSVGLAVADHLMSCHLAMGATALLVRRTRTGRGGLVETSLLEALLDLQAQLLTQALGDRPDLGRDETPPPGWVPAGLYPTADGHIAIAPCRAEALQRTLGLAGSANGADPGEGGSGTAVALSAVTTESAVRRLLSAGIDAAPLLDLEALLRHEVFAAAAMTHVVERTGCDGAPVQVTTTRSPIRVEGVVPGAAAAPRRDARRPVREVLAELMGAPA